MTSPRQQPKDAQAHADAVQAWSYALGLADGASAERMAAVTSLLLQHCDADPARLAAAAAVCRSREDGDNGYQQAEQLLNAALDVVDRAGAQDDVQARQRLLKEIDAQWSPEFVPYRWPTTRRRKLRWWLRRLATIRVRLVHEPPRTPVGVQRLILRLGRNEIGKMSYQVCDECRRCVIGKISIEPRQQGYGLGTRAVLRIYRQHPTYAWHTTMQYDTSGSFWPGMARHTGAAFTAPSDAACPHMIDGLRH